MTPSSVWLGAGSSTSIMLRKAAAAKTNVNSGSMPPPGSAGPTASDRRFPSWPVGGAFVIDLKEPADALDADVQRMDGFVAAREHQQGEQRGDRNVGKEQHDQAQAGPDE